jgi:hypothetical protein
MRSETLETDYLVVGSGAMGMAFVDTLVAESDADVIMVDRHDRPGGHWNDAYPFVRLHQPSAFYGVNSRKLGCDRRISSGGNAGLYEVASGVEICSYFDAVMRETLLPSGRVRYFPRCDYRGEAEGEHRFVSLVSGDAARVRVRKRVVDATYTDTRVPATHAPSFEVAPGVRCVTINELPALAEPPARYVIIGAGKTAIDACLWLLEHDVAPEKIRWVRPRDPWLQDRSHVQPGELARSTLASFADTLEVVAQAASPDDLFERLSAAGLLLRIDERVRPTMYRCATVTHGELAQLRRIEDVVRLGRVQRVTAAQIVLEHGAVPAQAGDLYVHCAAPGISRRPALPVFTDRLITLQAVRWCAPAYSAALAAHLEASRDDLAQKNALAVPIPYPEREADWIRIVFANLLHDFTCRSDRALRDWTNRCRMNPASALASVTPDDESKRQAQRMRQHGETAALKLQQFQAQLALPAREP